MKQNKNMKWSFIATMTESKVKDLIAYLDTNLTAVRKTGWCQDMRGVWMTGKKKAKARLEELNAKKQMA